MRRSSYKKYLPIALFFFFLLIIPPFFVERGRSLFFTLFKPLWRVSNHLQIEDPYEKGFRRLEAENQLLFREWSKLRSILEQNSVIESYQGQNTPLVHQIKKGVMAQVIYRDPTSWSSSVWIDVGEETNHTLKRRVVQKNSPVLLGKNVMGAVEYVGKRHSRVRLITDPGLKVAVRALRGSVQNLAKGVISGAGSPEWRSKSSLKGVGFNYDFPDSKGGAQDLVNPTTALIQVHDILVTTGMDGVFPPGLPVAEVTRITHLKEGAFCYDLEAQPITSLDEISYLYIIPPTGFPLDLFPPKE